MSPDKLFEDCKIVHGDTVTPFGTFYFVRLVRDDAEDLKHITGMMHKDTESHSEIIIEAMARTEILAVAIFYEKVSIKLKQMYFEAKNELVR